MRATADHAKRAYFHPTDARAAAPSRMFGCVRTVCNLALAALAEAWARQERVNYSATSVIAVDRFFPSSRVVLLRAAARRRRRHRAA
ncbi:hypothetical protein QF032_007711 [Streptomyces achromogenes]|uniref:helix-turn-helix domain-containing protein n=1 Tax=Streptomyces achromogenes TaxID=67255 RepID=UPI0027809406|nr:hypothetical protein [Streptomyces achromogenes]